LKDQDKKLLEQLEFVRSSLRKLTDLNNPQPFITHQDILTIPSLRSDTLIAIRAPPGTKLEVPDPDEGNDGKRRFQIYLRNDQNEVIDVFLVQAGEKEEKIHSPFNSPSKKNNNNSSFSSEFQHGNEQGDTLAYGFTGIGVSDLYNDFEN